MSGLDDSGCFAWLTRLTPTKPRLNYSNNNNDKEKDCDEEMSETEDERGDVASAISRSVTVS